VSVAREYLKRQGDRLQLLVADAAALPIREEADAVFSTATFHWVLDHPRLFRSLHDALKPGGRLVAQCGGAGNLARIHHRTDVLIRDAQFSPYFANWSEPWEFAGAEMTAQRLGDAGFEDIHTSIEQSPVTFPDAETFRAFITNVICRPHLAYLPDTATKDAFIDRLTQLAANDNPPFQLDYWRLNLSACRPRLRVPGPD
jgi:trans-aconitate 2-methyltransferase